MGVYTIRPGSNVFAGFDPDGDSTNYLCVDDPVGVPDDGTTVIKTSTTTALDSYGCLASEVLAIPARETISQVVVKYRFADTTKVGSHEWRGGMRCLGTDYWGATNSSAGGGGGGAFVNYSNAALPLRPDSGRPFIRDDFYRNRVGHSLQLVTEPFGLPRSRFTQVYLEVTTDGVDRPLLAVIRDTIVERVYAIPAIEESGPLLKGWQDVDVAPAAFTVLVDDAKERMPTRSKEGRANFVVACVIKGEDDPEGAFLDIYQAIEEQIEGDPSLGNLAIDAWVTGMSSLTTSETISQRTHLGDVQITVHYRHDRGDP